MGSVHCYFCGGKECKYELYEKWLDVQNTHNAIVGLYSNWITDSIVATARPSSRLIQEHSIVEQFHSFNIGAIINLQQAGEHRACGDGIINNEFSYCPEEFMKENIFYYNFGWEDLKTPGLDLALNIAQVIAFTISQGKKVAVHCHAGLGRTGLAIACYLVYSNLYSAKEAIEHVRLRRSMSVQTAKQEGFVWKFEAAIRQMRVVYRDHVTKALTIGTVLRRQRRYLHGTEERSLRHVPKIVHVLCRRLAVIGYGGVEERGLSAEEAIRLAELKLLVNNDVWDQVEAEECALVLMHLLIDWLALLKRSIFHETILSLVKPPAKSQMPSSPFSSPPQRNNKGPKGSSPTLFSASTTTNTKSLEAASFAMKSLMLEDIEPPSSSPNLNSSTSSYSSYSSSSPASSSTSSLPEPVRSTLSCVLKMLRGVSATHYHYSLLASVLLPDVPASISTVFLQQL